MLKLPDMRNVVVGRSGVNQVAVVLTRLVDAYTQEQRYGTKLLGFVSALARGEDVESGRVINGCWLAFETKIKPYFASTIFMNNIDMDQYRPTVNHARDGIAYCKFETQDENSLVTTYEFTISAEKVTPHDLFRVDLKGDIKNINGDQRGFTHATFYIDAATGLLNDFGETPSLVIHTMRNVNLNNYTNRIKVHAKNGDINDNGIHPAFTTKIYSDRDNKKIVDITVSIEDKKLSKKGFRSITVRNGDITEIAECSYVDDKFGWKVTIDSDPNYWLLIDHNMDVGSKYYPGLITEQNTHYIIKNEVLSPSEFVKRCKLSDEEKAMIILGETR